MHFSVCAHDMNGYSTCIKREVALDRTGRFRWFPYIVCPLRGPSWLNPVDLCFEDFDQVCTLYIWYSIYIYTHIYAQILMYSFRNQKVLACSSPSISNSILVYMWDKGLQSCSCKSTIPLLVVANNSQIVPNIWNYENNWKYTVIIQIKCIKLAKYIHE